jgi:hypothetical protein
MNATGTSTNPIDDLNSPSQTVVSAADGQAATSVSTLGLIQQARLTNQNRAVTLAEAQFGKDSKQATTARQAVTTTKAASARINVLSQQVSTTSPAVTASGWALQGRIYSSELAPLAGYTVFLVDAQKNYQNEYGFAYTDDTGYFLISYDVGTATGQPSGGDTSVGATGGETTAQPAAAATAPPAATQLFLQVADANANPVLLSEKAFVPVAGQATYQAVTLPAGAKKIGDPPAQLRSVALPPIAVKANAASKTKANK